VTDSVKSEIERFLKEFAMINGASIVEVIVISCSKKARVNLQLENLKIKNKLTNTEFTELYRHLIDIFSQLYGNNLVFTVMHKVKGRSGKSIIKVLTYRQQALYADIAPLFEIGFERIS